MNDFRPPYPNELYHYGILGMKWGVRRYQNTDGSLTSAGKRRYSSTSISSAMARRSNRKVDKSFDDWKMNASKKENAIELGKKANVSKLSYERNKSDKQLRSQYRTDNKAYKKALKDNTTYRKGAIRKEVGQDMSRKYLSEAKKVGKQLDKDPGNRKLQQDYNRLMSKHDVERAKARRAPEVAARRSKTAAQLKRARTITVKAAAATTAVAAGSIAVNTYFGRHNATLNGKPIRVSPSDFEKAARYGKKVVELFGYFY